MLIYLFLLKVAFSQKMLKDFQISQNIFHFSILNLLKLFYPVHGIDKMSFQTFFAFTDLVYLQLVQIGF